MKRSLPLADRRNCVLDLWSVGPASTPTSLCRRRSTQALNSLGPNPAAWSNKPRATTRFRHLLFPTVAEVANMPKTNKGTYAQIVVLGNPKPTSENILTLGQSGFIKNVDASPVLDPHFKDQFDLYKSFQYKPMKLYKNMQLEE